jgi:Acyltransferase family/Ankyrin repeats (many copies)
MSADTQPVATATAEGTRRHDLDALRAFAMLLGVALHASLSFTPLPWTVQDARQSEAFTMLFLAIHGFRMPLFFLVSGFFTAMLWRRRGIRSLLKNRALRILLPCMLGLATIIPAIHWVSAWASAAAAGTAETDDGSLIAAVRKGDASAVRERLDGGADVAAPDSKLGVTPLAWAALHGDVETLRLLIERGADLNARNRDGSSPLHSAAFVGRVQAVGLLRDRGARADARDGGGGTPIDSTRADWETTRYIATLARLPLGEQAELEHDRDEVRRLIARRAPEAVAATGPGRKSPGDAADGVTPSTEI